jgi:hypothetical protein
VIISRNAQQYSTPYWGAILLGCLLGAVLFYFFGKRDKNLAVASAVAVAVANANSQADANAQAIAQSAVQIYMQSGVVPSPREMEIVAQYHSGEITDDNNRSAIGESKASREVSHSI